MDRDIKDLARFKEQMYLVSIDIRDKYIERAINKIEELIRIHPDRAEPYYELGKLSYNNWNNQEAEKHFKKALVLDAEYFPTYTQYALVLIKDKRFFEAETLLSKAKNLKNKEESDINFYLGLLYQHQKQLDKAIAAYKDSLYFSISNEHVDSALKFIEVCKALKATI